jgi:hypothetical protein
MKNEKEINNIEVEENSTDRMKVVFMEDAQVKTAYGAVTWGTDFVKVTDDERVIWINKKNVVFIRSL